MNGTYPTPEQLIAASQQHLAHEDVPVPEWNGLVVPVYELTGTELAQYNGFITSGKQSIRGARTEDREITIHIQMQEAAVTLCWLAMKKPDGQKLIPQRETVGRLSAKGLARVFDVAARLSGLDEKAKAEEGKGSTETPSSASPSASRGRTGSRASESSSDA